MSRRARSRPHDPDEKPRPSGQRARRHRTGRDGWQGPTYYGRSQLKPAPFENWVVGGYVFHRRPVRGRHR